MKKGEASPGKRGVKRGSRDFTARGGAESKSPRDGLQSSRRGTMAATETEPPPRAVAKGHPAVPKLTLGGAAPGGGGGGGCGGGGGGGGGFKLNLGLSKAGLSQTDRPTSSAPSGMALDLRGLGPSSARSESEPEATEEEGASAQLFLQEVAILQMQAEGWKAEWSIAMQENERLRMALFDAQAALTLTLET